VFFHTLLDRLLISCATNVVRGADDSWLIRKHKNLDYEINISKHLPNLYQLRYYMWTEQIWCFKYYAKHCCRRADSWFGKRQIGFLLH